MDQLLDIPPSTPTRILAFRYSKVYERAPSVV